MTTAAQLSEGDSKVLAQVFDPESGPARAEVIVDPSLPADGHITDTKLLAELKRREKEAIKTIEAFEQSETQTQTSRAKNDAYRVAVATLDTIISQHPDYASARNNRAQVRRWRFGNRNMITPSLGSALSREQLAAGSSAVNDLKEAISLSSPTRSQDAVSPGQGKLLAQAYTQLGALYLAAAKDLEERGDVSELVEVEFADAAFSGWTKDSFEEEASRLFYLGGLYGNEVAKALAVHTNPHAKLCGNIVKEAMRKELAQVGA